MRDEEDLYQVPVGKAVIFLHGQFFKSHRFFAVLGSVTRLGSGVEIEDRGLYCRALTTWGRAARIFRESVSPCEQT